MDKRNTWAKTVQQKLHDIEIFTIRDFVENLQAINRKLQKRSFRQLHFTTMNLLLVAACNEIFEEGDGNFEAAAEELADHGEPDDKDSAWTGPSGQEDEDVVMPLRVAEREDAVDEVGSIDELLTVGPYGQQADV